MGENELSYTLVLQTKIPNERKEKQRAWSMSDISHETFALEEFVIC